jgi:hypothetical protein
MRTIDTDAGPASGPEQEPTLASMWRAAAQEAIDDDLLQWPPDVFALTDVILERSEAYRFALPESGRWPPNRSPAWSEVVTQVARAWCDAVEHPGASVPDLVTEEWRVLCDRVDAPAGHLTEGGDWRLCEALFTLHAVADEACAGLGIAVDTSDGQGCQYRARGRELLVRTGSLARIPRHLVRVLPKLRTLTTGTSARRSLGMRASLPQALKSAGTDCPRATRSPIRGESMRTCCSCRGHYGSAKPTSARWKDQCGD